jgi:dUTP pyrophosphatase
MLEIKVKLDGGYMPTKTLEEDVGWDVAVKQEEIFLPQKIRQLGLGFSIQPPDGYYFRLTTRSSTLSRYGILIITGTIEPDYRGELKLNAFNPTREVQCIGKGQRVAQLILAPLIQAIIVRKDQLSDTPRGTGGFGSTGI